MQGGHGNQTPQEPGADQSRGTALVPGRIRRIAGETCRVPGEEGAGQEAGDDCGDARLQASLRGAPGGRVGGGTRGTARELFVLSVLAPDHSGLTASEQPSLYWYISTPTALPVELTVMDPGTTQPLLEISVAAPIEAGIHRLRLSDHGVRLAPGVAYRWYVAVVPHPGRRSRDILAGGAIQRVNQSPEMVATVGQARREGLPSIYAAAGLWYA